MINMLLPHSSVRRAEESSTHYNLKCSCKWNSDHLSISKTIKEVYAVHEAMKQEIAAFCKGNGVYPRVEPSNILESMIPMITDVQILKSEVSKLTCSEMLPLSLQMFENLNGTIQSSRLSSCWKSCYKKE